MRFDVIAVAGALLALTAAAAQASPASVIPDTFHAAVRSGGQVVHGTAEGVGDQGKHDLRAGRRVTRDVIHGTVPHHYRHHHHYYHHRHLVSRTVQTHTVEHTPG